VKRVLLAGGGHAHVHVLHDAMRAPVAGATLTLVTPFARQMYSGMLPGWVAGHYTVDEIAIPLPALAAAAGVELIEGRIAGLDAGARRATLADGRVLQYDLLSLDTGPVMDRDAIPGAREHALSLRPVEHFVALFDRLLAGAEAQPQHVAVIGGGAGGYEMALALAWRLQALRTRSRVSLLAGPEGPLAGFTAGVRRHATAALKARRVTVLPRSAVAVEAGVVRLDDGSRLACDAPLLAIGTSAPPWLAGSGLALDARGFVATGPTLQSLSHPEVFAAGDVATRMDAPHPKSGVHAVRAGPPLAVNLRRTVAGAPLKPHTPQIRTLFLLSSGERRAIASWGGLAAEGAWVWRWKDRIDRGFIARYTVAPGLTAAAGR
jgi:pyridine nucleotide-disulfide oxidoreductase family protein